MYVHGHIVHCHMYKTLCVCMTCVHVPCSQSFIDASLIHPLRPQCTQISCIKSHIISWPSPNFTARSHTNHACVPNFARLTSCGCIPPNQLLSTTGLLLTWQPTHTHTPPATNNIHYYINSQCPRIINTKPCCHWGSHNTSCYDNLWEEKGIF